VGFGRRPAAVVVDFSLGFTDPESPLGFEYGAQLDATRSLLDDMRTSKLPIAFTTVAYPPEPHAAEVFLSKVPSLRLLPVGSRWAELDPRLGRLDSEPLYSKLFASAFFGTELHAWLTGHAADTLIVCGATTSGCVRATAVDGLQHGYRVIVPPECVADRASGPHEANLFDIDSKYGDVTPLSEVLHHLETT
jgi:maleamate amidohydrolase